MPNPFVVVVTIQLKPGREEDYERNLAEVLDRMRHEPTFINTVVHRDPQDPTTFMLYETWSDRDEFYTVQMRRDYRRRYEELLPELVLAPRTMVEWQLLRGDYRFTHGSYGPAAERALDPFIARGTVG